MQFIKAIEAAYPLNNVAVRINSFVAGSVLVNETTTFLDGDTTSAGQNAEALTTSPSSIFPPATFGPVTVSGVTQGNVTNPGTSGLQLHAALLRPYVNCTYSSVEHMVTTLQLHHRIM